MPLFQVFDLRHDPHGACELKNPLLCKNGFDKGHAPRGARKWGVEAQSSPQGEA